jgi:hypothetical protein
MGGGGKKMTVTTYTYRCRYAVAISFGPIDEFVRLDYNSDFQNYNQSGTSMSFDTGESLLKGTFYFGTESQGADPSLEVMHGGNTLYYRRIAYASFYCDLGQSPSMPATAFTLCRYYCPLSDMESYNVLSASLGLNPVQVLYDILTNKFYGFGLPSTIIDQASFRDAGIRLYNEGIGVGTSLSGGELYNVIRAVLDWVDAELVYDETYGNIKMILRRHDYAWELLPEVTESDMKAQSFELNRTSWYASKNVCYANFLDIARECDQNCVYTEDLGNFNITGNLRVQEFNFDIFTNSSTAQLVCNRLLHKHSYPLAKVVFECFGATGENLAIFGPFRLYHAYYGVWGAVYRVVEKRRQGPNLWKIEAVEEKYPPNSLLTAQAEIPYDNPAYWTRTSIEWSYRIVETPYRGVLVLGYSDDQQVGHTTLDAFGVSTEYCANEVAYACIGRLKTQVNYAGAANLYLQPDKHYVEDDAADIDYIMIEDEIMKVTNQTSSGEEIYYYASISNRCVEGTSTPPWQEGEPDYYAVGTKVYAVECRAFLADTLTPKNSYSLTITPHYLYPKPYYFPDDAKQTNLYYQGLIVSPTAPDNLSVSGSKFQDCTISWTRESRVYPQPVPCEGLSSYPMSYGTLPNGQGAYQDQILGWRIDHSLPGGSTSLLTIYADPTPSSCVSKYVDRAAAGLSNTFTVYIYARGVKGYDSPVDEGTHYHFL